MGDSWDHVIRLLTDKELEYYGQWHCSAPRCHESPTHGGEYRYVTGRAGRTTRAERKLCPEHAARFAAKHSLAMPDAAEERPSSPLHYAMQQLSNTKGESDGAPHPPT